MALVFSLGLNSIIYLFFQQQQVPGEYATLTRAKKLLPSNSPTSGNVIYVGDAPTENGGTLKANRSKHYASHPNIFEGTSATLGRTTNGVSGTVYHNGQYLPSMRLWGGVFRCYKAILKLYAIFNLVMIILGLFITMATIWFP